MYKYSEKVKYRQKLNYTKVKSINKNKIYQILQVLLGKERCREEEDIRCL